MKMKTKTRNEMPFGECPHCGHEWQLDDWYELGGGDAIDCPKCEQEIHIIDRENTCMMIFGRPMPTPETPAAPRNTEEQLVGHTFTLWLWPYFCPREVARPVVSGLTRAKADEIMEREKDRAPGVMFLEPDEMPNKEVDG